MKTNKKSNVNKCTKLTAVTATLPAGPQPPEPILMPNTDFYGPMVEFDWRKCQKMESAIEKQYRSTHREQINAANRKYREKRASAPKFINRLAAGGCLAETSGKMKIEAK